MWLSVGEQKRLHRVAAKALVIKESRDVARMNLEQTLLDKVWRPVPMVVDEARNRPSLPVVWAPLFWVRLFARLRLGPQLL